MFVITLAAELVVQICIGFISCIRMKFVSWIRWAINVLFAALDNVGMGKRIAYRSPLLAKIGLD